MLLSQLEMSARSDRHEMDAPSLLVMKRYLEVRKALVTFAAVLFSVDSSSIGCERMLGTTSET